MAPISASAQHAQALFESCCFSLPAGVDLQALGARMAAPDSGVLRAKGLLRGQLLQVAGGRWAVTPVGGAAEASAMQRPAVLSSAASAAAESAPSPCSAPACEGNSGHLVMIGLRGRWAPDTLMQL
jgi:hypothetical protein